MKVIVDTTSFLAGVFFSGPSHRILKAWRDGSLQLVISREILEEYQKAGEALAGRFPAVDLRPVLAMVRTQAETFSVQGLLEPICEDPVDDKFLACALAGNSRMIISSDKPLLKLSGFRKITVFRPNEFVDAYLAKTAKR